MANKQRGYALIELDRLRTIKFDMNALAEMEDALGRPVSQMTEMNVGMREMRAMVWAGLLHENPKLTLADAGKLIELDRLEEITQQITAAFTNAFSGGSGGKNGKSGSSGTGSESSDSPSDRSD